ncbi:MAG TPA: hypothetical protein VGM62_01895 [Chthoniobacterales bacterium]|jgi:hypothetical protein
MKTLVVTVLALVISASLSQAEGPVQKAGEIADETVDTAKNVGHSVAKGTKKAVHKVEDALVPDSDARRVDVTVSDDHIDMPPALKTGKTAFVVNNTGKERHNFEVQGNGIDEKFVNDVAPHSTKVLHVHLQKGSYTAHCPAGGDHKKATETKFTVR